VRDFQLRLYNFPAEKLFKPRKRLNPVEVPKYIKKILPFEEEKLELISKESNFIAFIDWFAFDLDFEHINDLKEYVASHNFYLFFKEIFPENDDKLINVIKYLYTCKRVLQGLVADGNIFSFHLPYLAEGSFDLECSITLIESGYFKQSLQALRNVIEVTLIHAFYAIKDIDHEDLIETEDHRAPALKTIISFLRSENLFTPDLERQFFELYKNLSGAVHSEVLKLNTGRTTTDYYTFNEWYEMYIKTANIHLQLIIRMIEIGI